MPTFERIRQISPYFFGVIAVLLIAYFVFTSGAEDVFRQTMQDPAKTPIAIVNGEKILYSEFYKKVQAQVEQQRAQQGSEHEVNETAIRNQVFEQMIEEVLLRQAAEKAGINVTDDELLDILLDNPTEYLKRGFTDTAGVFNRALYLDVIIHPENLPRYIYPNPDQIPAEEKEKRINDFRNDLIIITDYLRTQKLNERLIATVGIVESILSPTYLRQKYIAENSTANVKYIALDINDIPDEQIQIADDEIKSYYEKVKKYYKQKPSRKIKYISFPIIPSSDDSLRSNKRIELISEALEKATTPKEKDSIFEANLEHFGGISYPFTLSKDIRPEVLNTIGSIKNRDVVGPMQLSDGVYFFRIDDRREGSQEVVKASHILVDFGFNKDSAKKEAEKILQRARSGEDFALLAKQYSSDRSSAMRGGDLGYFERGRMVKEFENAAFSAPVGQIVGLVETDFGYHIIKVVDRTSDEIQYSEIKIDTRTSTQTRNMIRREAISFKNQIEDGINFDTLANRINQNAIETAFFEKNRPILGSQYLTDLAFEKDKGEVLEPIEIENLGLVIAQVAESRKAGTKPLEDVQDEIRTKLMVIKKLDALKTRVDEIYNKVSTLEDLSMVETIIPGITLRTGEDLRNDGMVPGYGQQFQFSEIVFSIPINQISKPIRGDRNYFIVQVIERIEPQIDKIDEDIKSFRKNQIQTLRQSAYYQWYNKLKEQADIKDNRHIWYKDY